LFLSLSLPFLNNSNRSASYVTCHADKVLESSHGKFAVPKSLSASTRKLSHVNGSVCWFQMAIVHKFAAFPFKALIYFSDFARKQESSSQQQATGKRPVQDKRQKLLKCVLIYNSHFGNYYIVLTCAVCLAIAGCSQDCIV